MSQTCLARNTMLIIQAAFYAVWADAHASSQGSQHFADETAFNILNNKQTVVDCST